MTDAPRARHRGLLCAKRELAEITRKLDRAQTLCIDGAMEIEELKRRSTPLKARRSELQALLAEVDEPETVALHPAAAQAYAQLVLRLHEALEGDEGEEVRNQLRALIERVEFIPAEGLGKFGLEIHGNLARLLRISGATEAGLQTHKTPAASGSGGFEVSHGCEVLVGAGAGFEPATFRL